MQHTLFVRREVSHLFERGKDLEVRTRNHYALQIRAGDTIVLGWGIQRTVVAIRCYPDFDSMLLKEEVRRIYPGSDRKSLLQVLRMIYPANKERLGVLVFELAPERR